MDEKTKLFRFLEKKKDETYKIQNKIPSNKTALAKIELLKELYTYVEFNFVSVGFLREREKKYWNDLMNTFKDKEGTTEFLIESLKHHYWRFKKYDILKVGNKTYTMNNN